MAFGVRVMLCLAAIVGTALPCAAQSKPDDKGMADALARFQPDQGGGIHLTKTLAVVFGGIKQGSGVALGPAVSRKFVDGSYVQVKGVLSVRAFKLLQARFDSKPLFGGTSTFSTRLRWQEAPKLMLYALGVDSPTGRVNYGERKNEWTAAVTTSMTRAVKVQGGVGLERYSTSGGALDADSGDTLPFVPQLPGLDTRPWFSHAFVGAEYDTRLSPEFSRTGRMAELSFHDYHDWHDGQDSFRRIEAGAEQIVPLHGRKGSIGVSAHTWLSQSSGSRSVPFFLMPTIGGGDYLRAYNSYRFRDRNALVVQAEYRRAIHPMVDVAALYEAGRVAPRVRDLIDGSFAQSAGIGLRVHTDSAGLFRVDLARGRDGFSLALGVSAGS